MNFEILIFLIVLAFIFDFINGFHDAANSIATIVSTGVLTPTQAVVWAAFFNFIAFLFFKLSVAETIGNGLIDPHLVGSAVIFTTLVAAISWNLITWYLGLPSSSSHALIGGLAGSAFYLQGTHGLIWGGFIKVLVAILLSPILGLIICMAAMYLVNKWLGKIPQGENNHWFAKIQLVSAAMLSLSHGGNDAQKTMGIIASLLFSASLLGTQFYVPFWVILSCNLVMALGTLAGGWRIVHTLGHKITDLNPMRGACAELGAATTIFLATDLGIPVSTTHTITGAIAGIGIFRGFFAIQIIRRIIAAWIFTLPATVGIAMLLMWIVKQFS